MIHRRFRHAVLAIIVIGLGASAFGQDAVGSGQPDANLLRAATQPLRQTPGDGPLDRTGGPLGRSRARQTPLQRPPCRVRWKFLRLPRAQR